MDSSLAGRTIWVTGAGGLIGSYFADVLPKLAPNAKVIPLTRSKLDLLDANAVSAEFKATNPALIIHCAALSRNPDCEANPALARRVNVELTRNLCKLAHDRAFVFFSSDQVFDGRNAPYREDAAPNPLSVYAETKVEAEAEVLRNRRHLIIRTSLNGGTSPTGDRGFNEVMRAAWAQGKEVTLFTDEFRSPIHARETALTTCELALRGCTGIFHVGGSERMSRWELGVLLASRWPKLVPRIRAGSLRDYKGPPRAPDLAMDCTKASRVLGHPICGMTEWLRKHPEEVF